MILLRLIEVSVRDVDPGNQSRVNESPHPARRSRFMAAVPGVATHPVEVADGYRSLVSRLLADVEDSMHGESSVV